MKKPSFSKEVRFKLKDLKVGKGASYANNGGSQGEGSLCTGPEVGTLVRGLKFISPIIRGHGMSVL